MVDGGVGTNRQPRQLRHWRAKLGFTAGHKLPGAAQARFSASPAKITAPVAASGAKLRKPQSDDDWG